MRSIFFGIFAALFLSPALVSANENCANKPVVEVVTFQLAAQTSIAEFKVAAMNVEKELQKISGYKRRSLLQSDTGEWIDIVNWNKLTTAQAAAVSMQENPVAQQFFAHIDPNSVTLNYYCEF
jgi:hypothetical protein